MLNIKIYKLLASIDATMRNRFSKYVNSPYFNANSDLTQLVFVYNETIKSHLNIESKEVLWNSVYPEKVTYDDKRLRQLNTKLLSLFEDFIAQEKYNAHPFLKTVFQLKQAAKDEFEILENQLVKQSKVIGERYKELSSEYHLSMFQIEKSYFDLTSDLERKSNRKSKLEKFNFKSILTHLDTFYLAEKMTFLYMQLFWESYSDTEKSDLLNDEILDIVKKGRFRKDPLLVGLYFAIRTITDPDITRYYKKLKATVDLHFKNYSKVYQRFFYDCMLTYTIRQANKGNLDFQEQIIELYKEALAKDVIVTNQKLSPITFRNITGFSLRTNQIEWAVDFINEYSKYLPDDERENAVSFNLARIHFYQKDYDQALFTLNQVDLEDIHYALNARTLLVAVYFELKEFDALISTIDSFRVFLNRTKILNKDRINNFKNYLKYAKRIAFLETSDKTKIDKNYKEVKAKRMVNKQWILEKIQELGYLPESVDS